jgi:hypothetical protein
VRVADFAVLVGVVRLDRVRACENQQTELPTVDRTGPWCALFLVDGSDNEKSVDFPAFLFFRIE